MATRFNLSVVMQCNNVRNIYIYTHVLCVYIVYDDGM